MTIVSNVNRKATANALLGAIEQVRLCAGLCIQTHRAYESPSRNGEGLTQGRVASEAGSGVSQPLVSDLENGKRIPNDALLTAILKASGFSMSASSSGQALARLLAAIRDNEAAIAGIKKDTPK